MDPQRFMREKITRPFAKQFMALGLKNGIVMEPHAQNVLIEVGPKGQPTGRFFHRDLAKAIPLGRRGLTQQRAKRRSVFGKMGHISRARVRLRQVLRNVSGPRKVRKAKSPARARVRASR